MTPERITQRGLSFDELHEGAVYVHSPGVEVATATRSTLMRVSPDGGAR